MGVDPLAEFYPATAMPDANWWQVLWPRPEEVIAALGVEPGGDAVDLCCGDGLFTAALAKIARRVVAIDLDPAMLKRAQVRLATAGLSNCEFVQGDAEAIGQLVHRPANFVLMANTFHGVPDKSRFSRRVAAMLKPEGRFAVINWHRRPRDETVVLGHPRGPKTEMRMTPDDVTAVVEPAGLKLVATVELPPYHYAVNFEKPMT